MSRSNVYPAELRARAVRMVAEVRPHYDSEWAAIGAVAQKGAVAFSVRWAGGYSTEPCVRSLGRVRRTQRRLVARVGYRWQFRSGRGGDFA